LKLKLFLPLALFALLCSGGVIAGLTSAQAANAITSNWSLVTPTIDGVFDQSEWEDAEHISFYHSTPASPYSADYVHIYIKNTGEKLYLLFDILPDNISDSDDAVGIAFDCNYDGVLDENITMMLDRNKVAVSSGNSLAVWSLGFSTTPNSDQQHTIVEVAINITLDSSYDGESKPEALSYMLPVGNSNYSISIMFSASPQASGWNYPTGASPSDPSTFTHLTFATSPPINWLIPVIIGVVVAGAAIGGGVYVQKTRKPKETEVQLVKKAGEVAEEEAEKPAEGQAVKAPPPPWGNRKVVIKGDSELNDKIIHKIFMDHTVKHKLDKKGIRVYDHTDRTKDILHKEALLQESDFGAGETDTGELEKNLAEAEKGAVIVEAHDGPNNTVVVTFAVNGKKETKTYKNEGDKTAQQICEDAKKFAQTH